MKRMFVAIAIVFSLCSSGQAVETLPCGPYPAGTGVCYLGKLWQTEPVQTKDNIAGTDLAKKLGVPMPQLVIFGVAFSFTTDETVLCGWNWTPKFGPHGEGPFKQRAEAVMIDEKTSSLLIGKFAEIACNDRGIKGSFVNPDGSANDPRQESLTRNSGSFKPDQKSTP